MGQSAWSAEIVRRLAAIQKPMVLDADALNLTAREGLRFPGAFITPHPAEAARLLHTDVKEILADAPAAARQLCKQLQANSVLKGACSVICDGERTAINSFGTPAMAKGGSGDALAGIMTALLAGRAAGAYAMDDLSLMQTACALHGLAGEMAEKRFGQRGVLATDLCECLGCVGMVENTNIPSVNTDDPSAALGRCVTITVEHAAGTRDKEDQGRIYHCNCGYVQEILDEKNEWQDACILGVTGPLEWFEGEVTALIVQEGREIWCVAAAGTRFTEEEVRQMTAFLGNNDVINCLQY